MLHLEKLLGTRSQNHVSITKKQKNNQNMIFIFKGLTATKENKIKYKEKMPFEFNIKFNEK